MPYEFALKVSFNYGLDDARAIRDSFQNEYLLLSQVIDAHPNIVPLLGQRIAGDRVGRLGGRVGQIERSGRLEVGPQLTTGGGVAGQ